MPPLTPKALAKGKGGDGEYITRKELLSIIESRELFKNIGSLCANAEFLHGEIKDLQIELAKVKHENNTLKIELTKMKSEMSTMQSFDKRIEERVDFNEDQDRRTNLKFSGIAEVMNENWEKSEQLVVNAIQKQLKVKVSLVRAHRVGPPNSVDRPSRRGPRDIVAKFANWKERDEVFRRRTEFRGTNIFVNEDLCLNTMKIRHDLVSSPAYMEARRNKKRVYFNYRKMVVKDSIPSSHERRPHSDAPSRLPPRGRQDTPPPTDASGTVPSRPSANHSPGLHTPSNPWSSDRLEVVPLVPASANGACGPALSIPPTTPPGGPASQVTSPATRPTDWPPVPTSSASPLSSPLDQFNTPPCAKAPSMSTRSKTGK